MSKVLTKKKKPTVSKLKKRLDAIFSVYIRTKYASDGLVQCYTCPKRAPIKEMQCGHFVSRQYLKTRWDERNCRPQCVGCNVWQQGRTSTFAANLCMEYGADIIAELERNRMIPVKLDVIWYLEEIEKYEKLVADL